MQQLFPATQVTVVMLAWSHYWCRVNGKIFAPGCLYKTFALFMQIQRLLTHRISHEWCNVSCFSPRSSTHVKYCLSGLGIQNMRTHDWWKVLGKYNWRKNSIQSRCRIQKFCHFNSNPAVKRNISFRTISLMRPFQIDSIFHVLFSPESKMNPPPKQKKNILFLNSSLVFIVFIS